MPGPALPGQIRGMNDRGYQYSNGQASDHLNVPGLGLAPFLTSFSQSHKLIVTIILHFFGKVLKVP